jgi:hypothetical protein
VGHLEYRGIRTGLDLQKLDQAVREAVGVFPV